MLRRAFHSTSSSLHENPLGLPRSGQKAPPQIPRAKIPTRRSIPHVRKVVVVASGKGGVGKSTVAVNLGFSIASSAKKPLRVGLLDLDIFGPSIPTLVGLQNAEEPNLTSSGALIPLTNHSLPTMSMGYLLPRSKDREDTPVVWRGLLVQKAVQQLLFDVDWRDQSGNGLDVLVVDMPPGTGDVPLTLGQLVNVDGAVIVSTPQDVALSDVRKGIAMLRKASVPITGLVLNTSYFLCPSCSTPHPLFGSSSNFQRAASHLSVPVLGELHLVSGVSSAGDKGLPYALVNMDNRNRDDGEGGKSWIAEMKDISGKVLQSLEL